MTTDPAVQVSTTEGVATVTLSRPAVHNAIHAEMVTELGALWRRLRTDDDVRAIVLTGAGERAFCSGIDRGSVDFVALDPMTYDDPGRELGPKTQGLWKPIVAAVNGMACGGAFYLLGEADVILAAEDATFFDPHVTYGMVAVFEPLLLLSRMPFGEVLRMALAGAHERISAARAMALGLVSEVVPAAELLPAATRLATVFASQPPRAIQATLRSIWAARDLLPVQAAVLGNTFLHLGASTHYMAEGQSSFAAGERITPRVRT